MTVGSIGNTANLGAAYHQRLLIAGDAPFSLDADSSATDQISIDLPNGFKVGLAHFGPPPDGASSPFSAQMLSQLEDIVDHLSQIAPTGTDGTTPPPGMPAGGRYRTLDTFHVELPNGYSVELSHSTLPGGGDNDPAAMTAMADAIDQLVDHFAAYAGNVAAGPLPELDPKA